MGREGSRISMGEAESRNTGIGDYVRGIHLQRIEASSGEVK